MNPSVFTNNEWKRGSGPIFESENPATQQALWHGHSASSNDINEVIQNAKNAAPAWAETSSNERTKYLNEFADILSLETNSLAEIISQETGKPLWESKNEVNWMISKVAISLEAYGRRCASMIREGDGFRSITRHKPHGVVGVMGPFNFPGHLPNGHIIPALLAGNTVIFKPSELTPLVAEETIKCWEKTGLPKGVLNLVQGGVDTGQALIHHPNLNGIYFTGSYKTGKMLAEFFGPQTNKIVALEMGGNNPFVVSKISDPKVAAFLTIQSAYLSSGQRCTCARRLIVVRSKSNEQFIEKLIEMIKKITVGPYTAVPEPYMGPVIRESHAKKILEAQKNLGGKVLVEMRSMGTAFLSPGLMDVTEVENRPDEEIFGPFLQLIWADNFDQAIEEANATRFGLAAGLLSEDPDEFDRFYKNVRAGVINWNTQLTGASSAAPFGGIECSGNFRPSAYYAADYCSYPVVSSESANLKVPTSIPQGLNIIL